MNIETTQISENLQQALDIFLQTASIEEAYQVLQQYPILLTDDADILFSSIIHLARQQQREQTAQALDERRDFIREVRTELEQKREQTNH
jgi:hypothetical protein